VQSGYRMDTKVFYGAFDGASESMELIDYKTVSRGGGIGRRAGLKIRWAYAREGSSPSLGTTENKELKRF
jgi:hypothetical protein